MQEQIITLLAQIVIMFLIMAVGFTTYKMKILGDGTTRQLSSLLAKVVTPAVVLASFQRDFDRSLFISLGWTMFIGVVAMVLAMGVAALLYRKNEEKRTANKRMLTVFPNNGFMALPLLQAMFGMDGVFLGSVLIAISNLFLWTYGVHQLQGGGRASARQIFWNPGVAALILGLLLFLSPVKLPEPLFQAVDYIGSLNTPLAMLVLGCFLAQTNLLQSFRSFEVLRVSVCRLLLVPVITLLLLFCCRFYDPTARMILLVSYSTPCAVACPMFAQMYDSDYIFSAQAVAVSTLLSILTMPLILMLYQFLS